LLTLQQGLYLTVNGTTTTINSTILTVDDINIVLAEGSTTDTAADGGGISLSGSTVKTFNWVNSNGGKWTSSENIDVASGKTFKIGTVDAVKQTTFSQDVDNGQFTVNITGSQLVSGSSTAYVGIGAGSAVGVGSLGDVAVLKGNVAVVRGGNVGVKIEASGSGQGGITIGAYGDGETITLTGSEGSVTLSQLITAVGGAGNVSSVNYYKVRTVVKGVKTSGGNSTVTFILSGSNNDNEMGNQPTGSHVILSASTGDALMDQMANLSLDVSVRSGVSNTWTNDLVSITTTASLGTGGTLYWPKIIVDAPGLVDNTQVRLIAINETDSAI
jgi:hypothetical protein